MDRGLVCSTGWCSFREHRTDTMAGKKQYEPNYLPTIWKPFVERFIKPDEYFVYLSYCDYDPQPYFTDNMVRGNIYAKDLPHRHDWFASIMMGAQFALCNSMDFVYIEQDCLVFGLDKAIAWARTPDADTYEEKKICYGFGENVSFINGWAEHSFVFIANDFLPEFLGRINRGRPHEQNDHITNIPEVIWQRMFQDVASYWPFGVGRKRPIPWEQEIFYSQQLNNFEVERFINLPKEVKP